jgi:hypothetical protein
MFAIDVNEWEMANLLEETRKMRLAQMGKSARSKRGAGGRMARKRA